MNTSRMRVQWIRFLFVVEAVTVVATSHSAQAKKPPKPPPDPEPTLSYILVPFETSAPGVPDRQYEQVNRINDFGQIAGTCEALDPDEGFSVPLPGAGVVSDSNEDGLLDPMTPRIVPAPYDYGEACSISDTGFRAGYVGRIVPDGEWPPDYQIEEGAIWLPETQGAETRTVGIIDVDLDSSWIWDINSSGAVIGGCSVGANITPHRSFVIDPESTLEGLKWFQDSNGDGVNDLMLSLGAFPKYVHEINDAGTICGDGVLVLPETDDPDGDGNPWFHADAQGNNTLVYHMPPLTSGGDSFAAVINDNGDVAGTSDGHVILWRPSGDGYTVEVLGEVPSEREHLQIFALSDTGWIVGKAWSSFVGPSAAKKAARNPPIPLVWHGGQMYRVLDLITNSAGWENLQFEYVDDEGNLVGLGLLDGERTACLMIPQMP